jgi:predicted transcriptional regulator
MKELTKAEEQVMQAIWKIDKGFAKEILEQMKEPKPAYNTVLTVIRVLVQKEFVTYKTYGKSNEYTTTLSKEAYSSQRLKSLGSKYFDSSPKSMVSFLLKEKEISIEDLDEILKEFKK